MNKIMKQIDDLMNKAAYIEFEERLSENDYEELNRINQQIKELKKQLPKTGYIVTITVENNKYFLAPSEALCFSTEPIYYETKEEAEFYLKRNIKDKENYKIEIIYKEEK